MSQPLAITRDVVAELCLPSTQFAPGLLDGLDDFVATARPLGCFLWGPSHSAKSLVARWSEAELCAAGRLPHLVDCATLGSVRDLERKVVLAANEGKPVIVEHVDALRFAHGETSFLSESVRRCGFILATSRHPAEQIETMPSSSIREFRSCQVHNAGWVTADTAQRAVGEVLPGAQPRLAPFLEDYGAHWGAFCLEAAGETAAADEALLKGMEALQMALDLTVPLSQENLTRLARRGLLNQGRIPRRFASLLARVDTARSVLHFQWACDGGASRHPDGICHLSPNGPDGDRLREPRDLERVRKILAAVPEACAPCRVLLDSPELRPLVRELETAVWTEGGRARLETLTRSLGGWITGLRTGEVPMDILEDALLAWSRGSRGSDGTAPHAVHASVRVPFAALGRLVRALMEAGDVQARGGDQKLTFYLVGEGKHELWSLEMTGGPLELLPAAVRGSDAGGALRDLLDWAAGGGHFAQISLTFENGHRTLDFAFKAVVSST